MKKILVATVLVVLGIVACTRVPITNRKQLLLFGDNEMNQMSFTSYRAFLDTVRVDRSGSDAAMVKRVGGRIQRAVEQYMQQQNLPHYLDGYQWEFNLVEDKQVNAWCMPGGKVVVYSGILPVTQNETGLATVLGHEISHAIAKHGNERMSEQSIAQGLLTAGGAAAGILTTNKSPQTQQLWNTVMGLSPYAYQFGVALPHSRRQESEADHLGLIFMAMAGYNPQDALAFWKRMAALGGNSNRPPEFLSDHPSDERRINDIQKLLPEAMKYYGKSTMRASR
jgi:predicted Zn-dependent protease